MTPLNMPDGPSVPASRGTAPLKPGSSRPLPATGQRPVTSAGTPMPPAPAPRKRASILSPAVEKAVARKSKRVTPTQAPAHTVASQKAKSAKSLTKKLKAKGPLVDKAVAPAQDLSATAGPRKAKAQKAQAAASSVGSSGTPSSGPSSASHHAAPAVPVPAKAADAAGGPANPRAQLVRDSFTMPQEDFGLIAILKGRAIGFRRPAKKSELLRAGLHALQHLSDPQLLRALDALMPVKAGRPKR